MVTAREVEVLIDEEDVARIMIVVAPIVVDPILIVDLEEEVLGKIEKIISRIAKTNPIRNKNKIFNLAMTAQLKLMMTPPKNKTLINSHRRLKMIKLLKIKLIKIKARQ